MRRQNAENEERKPKSIPYAKTNFRSENLRMLQNRVASNQNIRIRTPNAYHV